MRISIAKAGIKPSLYRKIKAHAISSGYNSRSCDIYTFIPDSIDDPRHSWSGGWSRESMPDTWDGDLYIKLSDGKLYKGDNI